MGYTVMESKTDLNAQQLSKFDATDPAYWTMESAAQLADVLGFLDSPEFRAELEKLFQNTVFKLSIKKGLDPLIAARVFFVTASPKIVRKVKM